MPSHSGLNSRLFHPLLVVALVLVVLGALYGSFMLDEPVRRMVLEANGGHWSRSPLVAMCSKYGDWPELMIIGAIGVFAARLVNNVRWQRILLSAMIASTLAGMVVNTSRLTTGRTRPRAEAEQGWYGPRHGGKWLIGNADFNSFPSGHTATAVGFAGVILFASPGFGSAALLAALAIILSRILLGAHHPSDVVAASVIAFGIAWLVWEFLGRRGRVDGVVRFPEGSA